GRSGLLPAGPLRRRQRRRGGRTSHAARSDRAAGAAAGRDAVLRVSAHGAGHRRPERGPRAGTPPARPRRARGPARRAAGHAARCTCRARAPRPGAGAEPHAARADAARAAQAQVRPSAPLRGGDGWLRRLPGAPASRAHRDAVRLVARQAQLRLPVSHL
ncbi:MAG: hypothetical protein AVDCRST_MAG85-3123, partial [uncultured Solirubrobacteraceae bacterium]